MVPSYRTVQRERLAVLVIEVRGSHVGRVETVASHSERSASAATGESHVAGVVERTEAHHAQLGIEVSAHQPLGVSVVRAVGEVGIGEDTLVHAALNAEVEYGLFVAVVNAGDLGKVALLVIRLHLVDDAGGKVLHSRLGVADHKLLTVHLYLLHLLTVDGYLAVVADLRTGETLHEFFDGGTFGCAERRSIIYEGVLAERHLRYVGSDGGALEHDGGRLGSDFAETDVLRRVGDMDITIRVVVAHAGDFEDIRALGVHLQGELSPIVGNGTGYVRAVLTK